MYFYYYTDWGTPVTEDTTHARFLFFALFSELEKQSKRHLENKNNT